MQQLWVCSIGQHSPLCSAYICRRFNHLMGFGLVVCWVRGALHCCITSWWRFLEANGRYIITPSRALPCWYLFLVTSTMTSGLIFPICEWGGVMCLQFLPSTVDHLGTPSQVFPDRGAFGQEQDILLLRWESSVRKRKEHKCLCAQWLYGEAASCTTPILWAQSTEKCCYLLKTVAWCFGCFFPRISWAFPNAAICKLVVVNLCKLGSCLM